MPHTDLLITGRSLLAGSEQSGLLENHGVAVSGDSIREIGPNDSLISAYPEATVLHTEHGLIMPGQVNSHTHAAMTSFR